MIRDNRCCLRLRWLANHTATVKGRKMRFEGYWVSAERGKLQVSAGAFDETELSDHSDWKEAWQNEDQEYPHGFLDPLTMLHDLSKRITGEIDARDLEAAADKFREGTPFPVNDLEAIATLIQLLIPKALPKPHKNAQSPDLAKDLGDNVQF